MTYSVLICDDELEQAEEWVQEVKKVAPLDTYEFREPPSNKDVRDAVKELLHRRKSSREGELIDRRNCLFDGVDVLVIDHDLIQIDENEAQHTGENIARLARTFAGCSVAVVLNQFHGMDFDLSLRGHPGSHADLNIDGGRLAIPGLWRSPPWDGYRPWNWQTISQAVETQRARENLVMGDLDRPIVEAFGMEIGDALRLSDTAFGCIAPDAEDFQALQNQTFRRFLSTTQDGRDAKELLQLDQAAAVRFIAARIGKWLERELLGPQDVLLDVPHMLQRFPFLLGERVSDVDAWNETIHNKDLLETDLVPNLWFGPGECLSRPAVWHRRLEVSNVIREGRNSFDYSTVPNLVFLEDRSVFVPIWEAKEFRAGFHNSYDRRFVRPVEGIRYRPQRRFAFG